MSADRNYEKDNLLQSSFDEFRLSIGLLPNNLSERAKEYFRKAMEEYSQRQLTRFCDHLNTYDGLEECRFDFMLQDFNATQKTHPTATMLGDDSI